MNPMNRRMFRDPMAARQASGILASSPQLASVVQQRQPVRMQTGGSQEIAVLAQAAGQGDMSAIAKLQSIASSNTTPASLRSAAAEVLNLPSISRIANQKQDAKDFFSSIRKGPESQVDVGVAGIDNSGPFITAGVNPNALSNVLSDATGDRFLSPNAKADMSADATAANTDPLLKRIQQNITPFSLGEAFGKQDGKASLPLSSDSVDQIKRAFGSPLEVFGFDAPADAPGRPNPIGVAIKETMYGNAETQSPAQKLLADADRGVRTASGALANAFNSAESGIANFFTPRVKDALAQAEAGKRREAVEPTQDVRTVPTASSGIAPVASNVLNDSMDSAVSPSSNVVSPVTTGAGEDLSNLPAFTASSDTDAGTESASTKSAAEKATLTSPATKSSQDKQLILTPKVVDSITANASPDAADNAETAALTTGQELVQKGLDILQGEDSASTSEKEKAEKIDAAVGITGTYKERVQKRAEVLKDLLGDREKDVRTDANYNLMMAGLLIASGESPDAMTNLAKGLAMGLKGYGDAIGEEAKSISKEDRALVVQAASEVGAEISSEKAAQIRASENALTRAHEKKMQDIRLGTSLLTAGAQMESAQAMQDQRLTSQEKISLANLLNQKQIADANIKSRELISSNTLEQNADMFNLGNQFKEDINEANNKLKKELAELTNESETMKLMKVIQSDHLARTGEELPDLDALAAVKASSASTKQTDQQLMYSRLLNLGYSPNDALVFSSNGALTALIKDLGPEGIDEFLAARLSKGNTSSQTASGFSVKRQGSQ